MTDPIFDALLDKYSVANFMYDRNMLQEKDLDIEINNQDQEENKIDFDFAAAPEDFDDGDNTLLNYHRDTITNNNVLYEKNEQGINSPTTIFINGITDPDNPNSPIYAVPGYVNGKKIQSEQELQKIAKERNWYNIYPSDPNDKEHMARVNRVKNIIAIDGQKLIQSNRTFSDKTKDFALDTGQAIVTGMESAGTNFNNFIAEVAAAPDAIADILGKKITNDPNFNYPGLDEQTAKQGIQSGLSWINENLIPEFLRGSTANIERKYTNEIYSGIVQGITEFATGAVPAAKIVGLTKGMFGLLAPNAAVRGAAWGMLADAAVVDPNAPDLVDVVKTFVSGLEPNERGYLSNLAMSIFEKHDADNPLLKRLKTANQGAVVGVLAEALIYGARALPWKTFTKALGVVGTASLAAGKKIVDTAKRIEIDDSTLGSTNIPLRLRPEETTTVDNEIKPAIVKPVKRRPGESGEYVGAPKSITSQQKLGAYRKNLLKLAQAGEEGRFWYERSGNAILDLVDGNVDEADKIAQAIAITSAGSTPVLANFQFAIQAYNQHLAGKEIFTGKFPKAMSARLKKLFDGEDWAGRKTNTFYNNIMAIADPSRAQGVTVDMHMLRIFGFDKKTEMPTDQQYTFVENEVNRIANKLGWTPYQVQAAMWVKQKADKAGKPVSEMKFDYSDALKRNLGQISSETKPSKTSGHFPEIFDAEMKEQADFHFRMSKALTGDNGRDLLAKEVGLLTPGNFDAPGIYEGVLSPGTQTYALMPMKYKGQAGEVDEATLELVKIYAVAKGILLKQDSVGAHRVFKGKGKVADRDAVTVDIGRRFTDDEMVQLDKLLTEEFGTTDFSPAATEYGVNIVHWMGERGKMDFTDFQKRVRKVLNMLEISDIDTPSGKLEAGTAASQKVYVTNTDYDAKTGWKEKPNGENYLEGTFGGRPSVQKRVRDIVTKFADRVEAVEDEIVRDYGWTKLDYNSAYRGKPKD